MIKNYVLDTNLLLDDPNVIFAFEDNNVCIAGTTLQELDSKKKEPGEVGYNAREAGRILYGLMEEYGDIRGGVPLPGGGTFRVVTDGVPQEKMPMGFSLKVPDNRIISVCLSLMEQGQKTVFVANDTYARASAAACGVMNQSLIKNRVDNPDYSGHRFVDITDPDILTDIYKNKKVGIERIISQMREDETALIENEFLTLRYGKDTALSVHREGSAELISNNNFNNNMHIYGHVKPVNFMQYYAIWALMHPCIELVVLKGPAGTAKTFLSLAAGMTQLENEVYEQILISRPNVEGSDPGFGFLPGDLSEKMAPLLASYNDNLINLCKRHYRGKEKIDVKEKVAKLFSTAQVDVCPLNYIRGRSLNDRYLICDEAQNANPQLMKAVVTRAGQNTKIIVAGDADQCDAPGIDRHSNGLVYVAEKMKGSPNTAVIQFTEAQCERSGLAKAAIERMR